jgi:hypothetical protein
MGKKCTGFTFTEPMQGLELQFQLLPVSKLKVGEFQRELSSGLVNKLLGSIFNGFLVPLLVVAVDDYYEVIDGQHRIETCKKHRKDLSDFDLPCIVLPSKFKFLPLIYNIEKSDNIKDQSLKTYNVYKHYAENIPDSKEREFAASFNFMSYLCSIAFAYVEFGLSSPSLVESVAKKLDNKSFLEDPFYLSIDIRRHRGDLLKQLENMVNAVCSQYGITDFNLKKSIISQSVADVWGAYKRKVDDEFDDGIIKLMARIEEKDWSWLAGR